MDTARAQGRLVGRAPTLRDAADRWHADALAGIALARGRKPFKPGTLKDYRRNLDVDLLEEYGNVPLDRLADRLDDLVASLQRRGLAASTVRNVIMPLRAIYRHAVRMKWVAVNPTLGLEVPTGSGRRMRVVDPKAIAEYVTALPQKDRALWACAFYAGLRRGELMALRWSSVDLAGGVITIDAEHGSYDQKTKTTQGPKSAAGERRVPVGGELRELLIEHRVQAGARPQGLVFARSALSGPCRKGTERMPFNDSTIGARAHRVWVKAGMAPVTLHDGRHTYASLLIAAMAARGVFNPKLLQAAMGHSSIQVTYDRYGHLFPGQEAELGLMLDEFLGAASMQDSAYPAKDAWSRLVEALKHAEPDDARPVVAEALAALRSWQDMHPCETLLPSRSLSLTAKRERAVRVQRKPSEGGS